MSQSETVGNPEMFQTTPDMEWRLTLTSGFRYTKGVPKKKKNKHMVCKEEQVQGCVKSSRDKRKRVSYDAEAGSFVQKNKPFLSAVVLTTEPDPNKNLFLLLFLSDFVQIKEMVVNKCVIRRNQMIITSSSPPHYVCVMRIKKGEIRSKLINCITSAIGTHANTDKCIPPK
jgi:hypothetical protein